MQTLKIDRSRYTLSPTRDAGAFAEKLRKCTGKTKLSPIKSERRVYPKFSAGDSTAEYVHRYWVANGFSDDHRKFFAPLNTEPATLYSGEDTHETIDDFELCAPVESIQTAPDDIAQPEPAAVESAPDVPMDPAAVDRAPDPAPAARALPLLPVLVSNALERIESGESLLSAAAWEWASANHYTRAFVDDWLIDQNHSVRHLIGSPEARFRALVDMVHSDADPAAVYGWKRAPVDTAPAAPEPAAAPVDPAPRADAAPVDTGAAPGGWMRPAAGMLSESEARAWPSAEPVESAPTPGYAFPADALPATHSDAAPVDVDTMRAQLCAVDNAILAAAPRKFSNGQYGGDIEAAARSRSVPAELKRRRKTLRAMISAARDAAADPAPVPGDSDPVPVNSAAPVDPDEQQPGETAETWFERIQRENREKRARIDALADVVAAGSGSIGFTHPSDPARYGIAGPDMSGRGAFRFSYFDAAGPIGDAIRPSLADAIAAGVEYGFTVDAAPLAWPDNPEPDAAPVATHSAPIADPVRYCIHRLRRVHDEINATRATTTTARGRRWVRIMNALRSLMSEHPERRAPVPADTLPADTAPTYVDVFADGFGFYCYSLRDGSKWTGRPSFEAAAAELAGMGMQARAAGLNPPVPADTAPDDDTTPAPLDGLDVIETADAETLAEFDRLSRAPGVAPTATDARPIPSGPVLRIPAGDLRARIPARFAPAYLLTA